MNSTALRFISIALLLVVAMLYFYTGQQEKYYQTRALPAARDIVTKITGWDKQTLAAHLSDAARRTISDQQLEQLANHYRQFGQLQSIGELSFSRLVSAFSLFGATRINYAGTVQFDSGSAQLNITLVESAAPDSTAFKIYNLTIRR